MVNQDEEGVAYTDHSGDERRQNQQQNQQQVDLDLNATANGSTESVGRNAEMGGTQNGQPNTSTFDRLGPGSPGPNPFGGIGSDDTQIIQELRHRMQAMEIEVKGLRKENVELKNVTKDLRSRRHSPHRSRSDLSLEPQLEGANAPCLANALHLVNAPHLGEGITQVARIIVIPRRMNLRNRGNDNIAVTRKRDDGREPHPLTDTPRSQTGSSRSNFQRAS
ncbi:hypothetical protein PIB30_011454 [Stylosanthes scabra]|uniref:Uncharacterized protein n=1 Tax=Stylosanthes scabra TaxID=79078 RepID=A0ABU6R6Z0_9FABA|nr:hypothetical protein [Stylosanthes scabra]